MMWSKRTDDSQVQDEYQQTEIVSRPMAAVFTVLIVLVLAAVAFSLFLGGRWLYQHVNNTDKPKVQVVENPITATTPSAARTDATQPVTSSATVTVSTTSSSVVGGSITATAIPATGSPSAVNVLVGTTIIAAIAHAALQRRNIHG